MSGLTDEQRQKIDDLRREWGEGCDQRPVSEKDRFWQQGYKAACDQIEKSVSQ